MKLAHFKWSSPIRFEEGMIETLVIENPKELRDTVIAFSEQVKGISHGYVLSEKDEPVEFGRNTLVISDLLGVALDSRSVMTKIHQVIQEESLLFQEKVERLVAEINQLAGDLTMRLVFDARFTEINDLSGVLKLLNFSVDHESMSPAERLFTYLLFYNRYFGRKLFILLHFKALFTLKEQKELLEFAKYHKLHILLLESQARDRIDKDDKDLCEIDCTQQKCYYENIIYAALCHLNCRRFVVR